MKKIFFFAGIVLSSITIQSMCQEVVCQENSSRFTSAFTAGYVFKHDDHNFRQVYGTGMGNVITADLCYHRCNVWGIGGKISYWLAVGRTVAFRRHTFLQELPITFYVRRMFNFCSGLQLYASLGGGFTWINEQNYLGKTNQVRGIGEVEGGLTYPVWCHLDLTTAFRYIFPRQNQGSTKIDVGGFDLRGGIAYSF